MPDRRVQQADESPTARLVIEQPRLSDEALYKCDVTYVRGKCPSISLVRVQMMALPQKAQIILPSDSVPSGGGGGHSIAGTNQLDEGALIGPLNEHEQLRLICRVLGGRPQPKSIIWRKIEPSGRRINLQHEQSRQPKSVAEPAALEVHLNHTLSSADLGAKFECHVEHEALDEPPARLVPATRQPEQPDSLLDLHPSRPPLEAEFGGGGGGETAASSRQSLDAHVFVDLNVGVASLDLFMSRVQNSNNQQRNGTGNALSGDLREGDLVELECVAYNSKPPANISWFNGLEPIEQLIDSSPPSPPGSGVVGQRSLRQRRLLQRNHVQRNSDGQTYNTHSFLSIKLSRHENRAQISCSAQNQLPAVGQMRPLSKSLELQVQHAPIVLMEPAAGISVNEQQRPAAGGENNVIANSQQQQQQASSVSIYCIYSANPSELAPNSTRWFKDGQQLQPASYLHSSAAGAAAHLSESLTATGYPVLNINQVSRRDAGRYDCQLSNSVGQSERLPLSEAARLEVNFRPSVRLRLFKPNRSRTAMSEGRPFQRDELTEIDPDDELILAGQTYVLVCDILEARPNKIEKFHWLRRSGHQQQPYQLIGAGEANQFVLSSLAAASAVPSAATAAASYACAASNALGPSDQSNPLELQLSYSPGPSTVRPVRDAAIGKQVLQLGGIVPAPIDAPDIFDPHSQAAPLTAGQKILLECHTQDPGRPRANSWLWFKNGQPIDSNSLVQANNSHPSGYNSVGDSILDDNPISGLDLSPVQTQPIAQRRNQHVSISKDGVVVVVPSTRHENEDTDRTTISSGNSDGSSDRESDKMKLLHSGRYLYIPSIQLAQKGNYSCVALNRFGSGPQQPSSSGLNRPERDSYYLNVALAPSFVQALPPRTYWPEANPAPAQVGGQYAKPASDGQTIMEMVCHVQCDPMCNIEWLRNGQPIDLKGKWLTDQEEGANYVSHQTRQSILDENLEANLFKSIESRLILRLQQTHMGNAGEQSAMFAPRERILARRSYLNGSNYTCQSTPNSMGPAVRSTSKFVVQYSPENVLIETPSDRLSLVEGSNGPRLSCEASGEPQVQYRWLVSKSSGSDLATSKYSSNNNNQIGRFSPAEAFTTIAGSTGGSDSGIEPLAINQLTPVRGVNDVPPSNHLLFGENLVELAASISEQRGVTISTLDLSQLSLDRKQSGHYICEASNKLGQSRQSVYVNVLYKPTCSGLHLHSLDMLMAPPNGDDVEQPEVRVKPLRASANDEYTLVRENSDDFINLRRTLVISPLLNGHLSGSAHYRDNSESGEPLSLQGSIFQSILDDRKSFSPTSAGGLAKDRDALIHSDDIDSMGSENNALASHGDLKQRPNQEDDSLAGTTKSRGNDAWTRLNALLLKFLNTYVKQVKTQQDSLIDSQRSDSPRDKRQNPRGSSSSSSSPSSPPKSPADTTDRLSRGDFGSNDLAWNSRNGLPETTGTKNLLTFACMAQDGNPMGNLSFDWSFGSISLPEGEPTGSIDLESVRQANGLGDDGRYTASPSKPQLIYANQNRTVSVMLVRRLDTHSALSPFQMSLLTLNVIIDRKHRENPVETSDENKISKRNADIAITNERHSTQAKAPVIRSRPYITNNNNNPRVNHGQQQQNSNIQFANEFETRPAISSGYQIDLDEHNWQEKLGALLNCRVSNQIGTSDVCQVRVNLAERLKSLSSSESEFAKWRMPSLAQKSLLIVSILVGCALIVFSASALLIGPYLRNLSYKSSETVCHEGGENNTGKSTSSQKSSVLGLLTNGESSLQGSSSDEDSNGRSNHTDPDNGTHTDSLQPLDLGGSSLSGIVSSCGYHTGDGGHSHYQSGQMISARAAQNLMANYDKPRRLDTNLRAAYQNGAFSERTPARISGGSTNTSHYIESFALSCDNSNINKTKVKHQHQRASTNLADNRTDSRPSTGSKLLASLKLKSLSKFKVDRISDQASLSSHLADLKSYHGRSVSGSGTSTTGMSNLRLDSDLSLGLVDSSGSNPKCFASPAFRHSYTSARRTLGNPLTSDDIAQRRSLTQAVGQQPTNMHDPRLVQQYNDSIQGAPTYSNLDNYNAMDEFIRRKELESSLNFSRSGSTRYLRQINSGPLVPQPLNHHSDLNNLYSPQMMRHQPYYPPTGAQQQSMTLQRSNRMVDYRPPVAARPMRRVADSDTDSVQQYQMPTNNRYSIPSSAQLPMVNSSIATGNTIDNHLDNFPNTLATMQYQNSGRYGPPPPPLQGGMNEMRQLAQNIYGKSNHQDQQSTEHIYDVNAYATPEQTPQRGQNGINAVCNNAQDFTAPRSRVGQLIQTFNSALPD